MIYYILGGFVGGCALGIAFCIGFRRGFIRGIDLGGDDRTELARLKNLLARAGINFDGLPANLDVPQDPTRSWTGAAIDPTAKTPMGSIPRWDEPEVS